jgi:hypothetical protein
MRHKILAITVFSLLPLFAAAQSNEYYKWVDKDGVTHYGDSIPAEYAELPKEVVNDHGVTVEELEGKKTEEQIEQERLDNELRVARELQKRADQALLATYLSVDEIKLHRDRRVELFQAQSRVTELYLRNLERRLAGLLGDAGKFKPYSDDPDAPMIDPDLAEDIRLTRETISRHESNLEKFQTNEDQVIARFEGDINRFKSLKGIE